jgi:alkylation response protein AidB-like acyl-CoA dehydrogenase
MVEIVPARPSHVEEKVRPMTMTALPAADLQSRVNQVRPALEAHGGWNEDNRRLHDGTLAALTDCGALRMRVPTRYGGSEADFRTVGEVVGGIAQADGSAAWTTAVWSMCAWLAGLFPDAVQDEVFADPRALVCGVLSPTATARPDGGDLVIDGRWSFVSGALHSTWQVALALSPTPDGTSMWPVMAMVPTAELTVVDDWHSTGLRGTGSVTTVAENVRVPASRVLPMPLVLEERYASERNAASPVWGVPMMAAGCGSFAGAAVGLARAALNGFLDRLEGRKITYTDYASQREAPVTHLRVAEAAYLVDEAEFHASRLADLLDRSGAAGERWDVRDRVGARAALGRVFRLTENAVDVLARGSGATSLYRDVAMQRIRRDVQALNLHALMHADTNAELYGRTLVGIEPNTAYL